MRILIIQQMNPPPPTHNGLVEKMYNLALHGELNSVPRFCIRPEDMEENIEYQSL